LWFVFFMDNKNGYFPFLLLSVWLLYFFSGNFYGLIAMVSSIILMWISVFLLGLPVHPYVVVLNSAAIIAFYFILEMFSKMYNSIQMKFSKEFETFDRKIAMHNFEISANKNRISLIDEQIKNFLDMGAIIQTFQSYLTEEEIIERAGEIAKKIINTGKWTLVRSSSKDPIAQYIKWTGLPFISSDIKSDKRFNILEHDVNSAIAVPIESAGSFWGIIKGVSDVHEAFSENDLRLLSVLSEIISNVLSNADSYAKLQSLAITDGLTGLFTQTYFKERLAEEAKRAKSNGFSLSVAIFDIDFFKSINDLYGHQAGDKVLKKFADILRKNLRKTDLIARYGGEEFVFMMLHSDSEEAYKVAEKIRKAVEEEPFIAEINGENIKISVTVSAGVASNSGENDFSAQTLIKQADSLLYQAKRTGRNKVVGQKNE